MGRERSADRGYCGAVRAQVRVHESLKHQSILALIGGETRLPEGQWPGGLWMVLDLGQSRALGLGSLSRGETDDGLSRVATGGDLFDKISEHVPFV